MDNGCTVFLWRATDEQATGTLSSGDKAIGRERHLGQVESARQRPLTCGLGKPFKHLRFARPLIKARSQHGCLQQQSLGKLLALGIAGLGTGLTPHAYIIQRRLELGKSLIRSGVGLADAGCEAGFADQSHFHRAFVRRFGMTPGAYAAAMR